MKLLAAFLALFLATSVLGTEFTLTDNPRKLPATVTITSLKINNLLFSESLSVEGTFEGTFRLKKLAREGDTLLMKATLWYQSDGGMSCDWEESRWVELQLKSDFEGKNPVITKLSGHYFETNDNCHHRPEAEVYLYQK